MTLLFVALLIFAVVLMAPRMAGAVPACIDRGAIVIVDPDTGIPAIVTAGGALTVTGSFSPTASAITQNTNTQIPIVGSTVILAANANRKRVVLVNMDTTNTVFIAFGGVAALTTNFPLFPRTYFDSDNGSFAIQQEIRGIEGAGAPTVAVLEWI